jgi:hypothetical protein
MTPEVMRQGPNESGGPEGSSELRPDSNLRAKRQDPWPGANDRSNKLPRFGADPGESRDWERNFSGVSNFGSGNRRAGRCERSGLRSLTQQSVVVTPRRVPLRNPNDSPSSRQIDAASGN